MAVSFEKEYHAILKACSDFGFSDTDDVPLSAIVRSAFQTLRDATDAQVAGHQFTAGKLSKAEASVARLEGEQVQLRAVCVNAGWEDEGSTLGLMTGVVEALQSEKATNEKLRAQVAALTRQLKEARYAAKVLVSAWDDDARPTHEVCVIARTFEKDQR